MSARHSRPKGTQDFLPPDSGRKRRVEEVFRRLAENAGFQEVVIPTFEHLELYVKSSGDTSDIVTKEMYSFKDRAGRDLTLRPEGTPGVVRAVLENRYRMPCRLYYAGPCFRYGRPQRGRFREFNQLGVEVLGEASPRTDVEVIRLGDQFFAELGISDRTIQLNSIGCRNCRPDYRAKLVSFLAGHRTELCDECRVRLERNPMRAFDCKNADCQSVLAGAPAPGGNLCPECEGLLRLVRQDLEGQGVAYTLNDRLVRGLDYYNRTTFEYTSGKLGAQDSLGGGGRYDYLVEEFGGPSVPGIGFALGLERTMLAMPASTPEERRKSAYVVWLSEGLLDEARKLLERLRTAGVPAQIDYDARRVKHQFKSADTASARCCVVVGEDELAKGVYSLKDLVTGEQTEVSSGEIVERVRRLVGTRI